MGTPIVNLSDGLPTGAEVREVRLNNVLTQGRVVGSASAITYDVAVYMANGGEKVYRRVIPNNRRPSDTVDIIAASRGDPVGMSIAAGTVRFIIIEGLDTGECP